MRKTLTALFLAVYIIGLSLGLILVVDPAFYNDWLGFLSICGIPALVLLSGLWHHFDTTGVAGALYAGIRVTALIALAGAGVAFYALYLFGDGRTPPTVVAMMFVIFCVVVTMWILLVLEGTPLARRVDNPFRLALLQFILIYVVAGLLYPLLFDFEGFAGLTAESYSRLPQGLFDPWFIIVTLITSLGVIFALTLFDQVPFGGPGREGARPLDGLLSLAAILAVSFLITGLVRALGLDLVEFMVRGPISFLFGLFILRDTGLGDILAGTGRFRRGAALTLASLLAGAGLCLFYEGFQQWWAPALLSGAPAYQKQLWLANAMLSVTFPMIIVIMAFFRGWPISRMADGTEKTKT